VDVRVIAATNRLLANEAREGRFRLDLYHRLSVIRIEMPPLRHRPDDILLLAHHFARRLVADPGELLTGAIQRLLQDYHWPGNARELRNAIERIAIAPDRGAELLQAETRAEHDRGPNLQPLVDLPFHEARQQCQESFERRYLEAHLRRSGGVVARLAEAVGLPRQTVYRLLNRHGLREPDP
jgi:DNA-binding NtrC family response regulator